jgi:hypothetical protein
MHKKAINISKKSAEKKVANQFMRMQIYDSNLPLFTHKAVILIFYTFLSVFGLAVVKAKNLFNKI